MHLKPIQTEEKYESLPEWVDQQFRKKPALNSPEGYKLKIALLLITAFED